MLITESFISGRIGRAIYATGEAWFVADLNQEPRSAHAYEIADFRSGLGDFRAVAVAEPGPLCDVLARDVHSYNLLFLLLSVVDPERSLNTKLMCAKVLDSELANEQYLAWLRHRVLSSPLALEARTHKAKVLSYVKTFERLSALLRSLYEAQHVIDEVYGVWNAKTRSMIPEHAAALKKELVDDGTLADVVTAALTRDVYSFNEAMIGILQRHRPAHIELLARPIIAELRSVLQHRFFDRVASQIPLPIRKVAERKSVASRSATSIEDLLASEERPFVPNLKSFESKSQVDKQIAAIREELTAGRPAKVGRYIEELVRFQLGHSERDHLAKSLCLLASASINSNQLDIADQLSRYAISLDIEDEVVFTTRAEVLKSMGQFEASLEAYKLASLRFPGASYAWNGIGDVLKEAGRYEESITAYQQAQRRFPDSSVPRNGLVATLRAQGNRREALQEAIGVLKDFPDDRFSIATFAGALAANGKYDFAIQQYEKLIGLGRPDVRTLAGYIRALNAVGRSEFALKKLMTLRNMVSEAYGLSTQLVSQLRIVGRLKEAEEIAKNVLHEAPGYTPMKYQLATILVSMGRYADAEVHLPKSNLRSEMDWVGYRAYLTAIIGQKRFVDAKKLLNIAISKCCWQRLRVQFVNMMGFAYFKLKLAKEAIAVLEKGIDLLDEQAKQSRIVLLGAAQKARGKDLAANSLLVRQVQTRDPRILEFRDAALRAKRPGFHIPVKVEMNYLLAA